MLVAKISDVFKILVFSYVSISQNLINPNSPQVIIFLSLGSNANFQHSTLYYLSLNNNIFLIKIKYFAFYQ